MPSSRWRKRRAEQSLDGRDRRIELKRKRRQIRDHEALLTGKLFLIVCNPFSGNFIDAEFGADVWRCERGRRTRAPLTTN